MEESDEVFSFEPNGEEKIDDDLLLPMCTTEMTSSPPTKRCICPTCQRPLPATCICVALPKVKLSLMHTYCIILQHPNESKQHQNCTLPFIEHCVDSKSYLKIIGRRFPTLPSSNVNSAICSPEILPSNEDNKLAYIHCMNSVEHAHQTTTQIWLLSSNDTDGTSITLTQGLQEWEAQKLHCDRTMQAKHPNIILIALDATWKYANEMDRANVKYGCYPTKTMRRVRLTSVDFHHPLFQPQSSSLTSQSQPHTGNVMTRPKYNRFTIRTPPRSKTPSSTNTADDENTECNNLVHLSTAECLAYVLARIEQNDDIYHTVMKPLDLMVEQWQSHYTNSSDI